MDNRKSEKDRVEELEAKLDLLESKDNMVLAEQTEDMMLLNLFSDLAADSIEYTGLLSKMLERISIIKNITFCSCGVIEDEGVSLIASYCSCSDEQVNPKIRIEKKLLPAIGKGPVFLENEDLTGINFEAAKLDKGLIINEILIFPFNFEIEKTAVLIFGNEDSKSSISLNQLTPLLKQLTFIVEHRINELYLLRQLKKVNAELEDRVQRRTGRLEEINTHLKSEIEKRRIVEEKLEFSEAKFREIFNNAHDIIILWSSNEQGIPVKILEVNDRALSIMGYTREEFLLLDRSQLSDPDETRYDPKVTAQMIREKGSHTFEVTLYTKHKKKIPTEISAHKFIFFGENVVLAIHRDITERKQFEQKLIEAKELAEESDRLKSTFLANMSHEIRTPMNAIIGFTDLLQSGDISHEDRATFTKIIQQKGEQLLALINDILDLSKIEADQIDLDPVECNMSEFFKTAGVNWQNMIDNSAYPEIELRLDYEEVKDLVVHIDDMRLCQVLNNLVSNAIKFTSRGRLSVACRKLEDKLFFSVEDTGIGIPENKYAIIFDRFRQVDEGQTRHYGGTGLGLAICKKLVTIMGGEIGVQSILGKGSTFWFTLSYQVL